MHTAWCEEEFEHRAVEEFWLQLGMRENLATMLTELHMWFIDGRLRVAKAFQDREDARRENVSIILGVLRVTTYSRGRFVRAGKTLSALMAGSFLGLDSLVAKVFTEEAQGGWYLAGCKSFSEGARLPYEIKKNTFFHVLKY